VNLVREDGTKASTWSDYRKTPELEAAGSRIDDEYIHFQSLIPGASSPCSRV
jgi:hypothetical protein